jgi:hypothetical protein
MAKPNKTSIPAERLALYDALIATVPQAERKGAAMAYTSLNGHMVSYMNETGVLALKLPPGAKEEFLQRFDARLQEAYGIVQKDYVRVPDAVLADTAVLAPYFLTSWRHTEGLKPKPTKKRRPG